MIVLLTISVSAQGTIVPDNAVTPALPLHAYPAILLGSSPSDMSAFGTTVSQYPDSPLGLQTVLNPTHTPVGSVLG